MPHWLAQVEGLDRHAFGRHFMSVAAVLDTRSHPCQVLFEGSRPVIFSPQQQTDQVSDQGAPPSRNRRCNVPGSEPWPSSWKRSVVLLHRLEGEGVVEQVGPVHQGDLLQPLPGVVVPVGEAVDDQGVADRLAQVEGLDGDPLGATSWVWPSRVMRGASRPRYCS